MSARPASARSEARALISLAWPIALAMLGHMGLVVTDVVVSGRDGTDTLAAVTAGALWSQSLFLFGIGFLQGLAPFFAAAWGEGDRARGGAWLRRAIAFALILSVPLTAGLWLAAPALSALGQPPAIVPAARAYCVWMAWGIAPGLVFAALAAHLQGEEEVKSALWVVIATNILNIVLDLALVFGHPTVGLPPGGALGCAAASSLCRIFMMCALAYLARDRLRAAWREGGAWCQIPAFLAGARLALPVALQVGLEQWAFTALGLMMGALGKTALAAHSVLINMVAVAFMIPLGIGSAATTRVGHLIGQGRAWTPAARWTIGLSAAWSSMSAALLWIGGVEIARLVTEGDAGVVTIAARLIPLVAAFMIADGVQVGALGVLRGLGDTAWPTAFNLSGYWLLGLPIAYAWGVGGGGGVVGIWAPMGGALLWVAALACARIAQIARRRIHRTALRSS